ncbi:MAG: type VI secretion system tube protein Hcp [Myxococcales bacterium]|nr:type VI secretion system tube protein Hcp [Myxococcales bacterium]
MAESVHLKLKANGTVIEGESTQTSLGREKTIECTFYEETVKTARETGSAMATGRRQHGPIKIQKRIDKSSPLLMKALCDNTSCDAEFNFFRPNPAGDGTTEQFYTVVLTNARVAGVKQWVPDCLDPASNSAPPLEEVEFVFHTIKWLHKGGKTEHEDTWSGNK